MMSRLDESERQHARALARLAAVIAGACNPLRGGQLDCRAREEIADLFVTLGYDDPILERIALRAVLRCDDCKAPREFHQCEGGIPGCFHCDVCGAGIGPGGLRGPGQELPQWGHGVEPSTISILDRLQHANREEICEWLQWADPNGSHTDEIATRDPDCEPYTRAEAIAAVHELLEVDEIRADADGGGA